MKKKYSIVLLGFLTCLLMGCSAKRDLGAVTQLDPSVKVDAVDLQIDTVNLAQEFIYAKQYMVYRDSVLIVVNKPAEEASFIELRSLTDNRLIGGYIRQGKGPGEMLRANVELEGNTLKVSDFVKQQIVFIDLDAVLSDPEGYRLPPFEECRVFSYGKNRMADGRLVFENPYCFDDKKSGIKNDAARLFIGDSKTTDEDFGEHTYQTRNVSQGNLFMNPSKSKLVYASFNVPVIEIYDSVTTPLRTILGPEDFSDQQFVVDRGEVIFKMPLPYAYLAYCYDDNYFYLGYAGERIDFNVKQEKDLHTWIFRFDWDGNFVDSYYYPGYVNAISVSGDGKSVYASARDEDNMPFLVKLSGIEKR